MKLLGMIIWAVILYNAGAAVGWWLAGAIALLAVVKRIRAVRQDLKIAELEERVENIENFLSDGPDEGEPIEDPGQAAEVEAEVIDIRERRRA